MACRDGTIFEAATAEDVNEGLQLPLILILEWLLHRHKILNRDRRAPARIIEPVLLIVAASLGALQLRHLSPVMPLQFGPEAASIRIFPYGPRYLERDEIVALLELEDESEPPVASHGNGSIPGDGSDGDRHKSVAEPPIDVTHSNYLRLGQVAEHEVHNARRGQTKRQRAFLSSDQDAHTSR